MGPTHTADRLPISTSPVKVAVEFFKKLFIVPLSLCPLCLFLSLVCVLSVWCDMCVGMRFHSTSVMGREQPWSQFSSDVAFFLAWEVRWMRAAFADRRGRERKVHSALDSLNLEYQ